VIEKSVVMEKLFLLCKAYISDGDLAYCDWIEMLYKYIYAIVSLGP